VDARKFVELSVIECVLIMLMMVRGVCRAGEFNQPIFVR